MKSFRLLGRCGSLARSQLNYPRQPARPLPWRANSQQRWRVCSPVNGARGLQNQPPQSPKDQGAKSEADDDADDFDMVFSSRRLPEDDITESSTQFNHESTASSKLYSETAPTMTTPFTDEARTLAKDFGFLFDCDGVLHRGNEQIDGATAALRVCRNHHLGYFFLTNGGGNTTEDQKAESLRKKMGIAAKEDIFTGRVIQSHTPLTRFADKKKLTQTVYITGRDPEKARHIARTYGFKKVVTADDILEHYEHIYPFDRLKQGTKNIGKGTPFSDGARLWRGENPMAYDDSELRSGNYLRIDHIFVWNDPRDWSLETQIIYDLLVSHKGYLGTVSNRNGVSGLDNNGYQIDGQPKLWISNLDMFWKTEYPINRFGTGAFLQALRGVWWWATGQNLRFKYMGKPSGLTYEYAHDCLLRDSARRIERQGLEAQNERRPIRRVYMIGDNPESDIRGAKFFKPEDGTEYVPILVRTGVFQESEAEPRPRWKPAVIVDDVLDAVVWVMRREGIDITRETANV